MLMSRYKVAIKEEPEYAHETFEERKARILNAKPGLTLTFVDTLLPLDINHTDFGGLHSPIRVPLVFTKRD